MFRKNTKIIKETLVFLIYFTYIYRVIRDKRYETRISKNEW
jgi:hypothetical protein